MRTINFHISSFIRMINCLKIFYSNVYPFFESLKKSDSKHINKGRIRISYFKSDSILFFLKKQNNCKLLQKLINWFQNMLAFLLCMNECY